MYMYILYANFIVLKFMYKYPFNKKKEIFRTNLNYIDHFSPPDKCLATTLPPPKDSENEDGLRPVTTARWSVWLTTGADQEEAVKARLRLVLYGTEDTSDPIPIQQENEEEEEEEEEEGYVKFSAGSTQQFDVITGGIFPLLV